MKGKKSKKKIVILVVCIIAAAAVMLLLMRPKGDIYTEEIAKTQDIVTYYSFSGNIEAKDSQTVHSQSTLSIKTLHVKEGDRVSDGDLLFELDDSSMKSNLEQAAANVNIAKISYEKAQGTAKEQQTAQVTSALSSAQLSFDNAALNLKRMNELFETGGIAEVELEQAQSTYDASLISLESAQKNYKLSEETVSQSIRTAQEQLNQAKAAYSSIEEQMDDTKVFAEVSGEIAEIYVEENASLIMGTEIIDIVNFDDLEVTIKVDEYELNTVATGKETKVAINAIGKEIVGTVSDISRQAVVVNGVSYFPTSLTLEKDKDLRVGMSVEVRILNHSEKNVTTISMKALQFDNENKPFVYYRDLDGNVVTKYVAAGINDGNIVQIIDGVKSGETILLPEEKSNVFPQPGMTNRQGVSK